MCVLERAPFVDCPWQFELIRGRNSLRKALDRWAYQDGVKLKLIHVGKPAQNVYIESFNGRFRDECLNDHWFISLAEAQDSHIGLRRDYNEHRAHSIAEPRENLQPAGVCNKKSIAAKKKVANF